MPTFGGDTAESYYDEGVTASMKGDLETAVAQFQKAIRMDHTMASAYHQLGKCYQRMGNAQRAVELLHEVVMKRPTLIAARIDYGSALAGAGRGEDARKQFVQVLALRPGDPKAQLGLAQAYFSEGDWVAAMNEAKAAIANGPANFSVQYLFGRSAKLAGQLQQAETALRKADSQLEKSLAVDPEKIETHYLRGEVHFVLENYPAALEHYNAAIQRAKPGRAYSAYGENFTLADALAKKGICLQRIGQHAKACEVAEQVLAIDPDHKLGKLLRDSKDQ